MTLVPAVPAQAVNLESCVLCVGWDEKAETTCHCFPLNSSKQLLFYQRWAGRVGKMVTPTRIHGSYNQAATLLPEGQIPQDTVEREDQTLGFHNVYHRTFRFP